MDLPRTFHTLRFLKPVQIAHRLGRVLRRIPPADSLSLELYELRRRPAEPRIPAASPSFDGRAFRFLDVGVEFAGEDRWRPPHVSPLWLYKLHYFQYLEELEPERASALIRDWIESNPPPAGVGWQPYPLSMRIREWIEWLLAHPPGTAVEGAVVASLVHQTAALEAQLEYEYLANHLLENAITLCWAGSSLSGPRADRWLARGWRILRAELSTQLLGDGTHDERSPMYQAWIAEALLRLAGVAGSHPSAPAAEIAATCRQAGGRMIASLDKLTHPDGDYALLNDTALGEAARHGELARRFGIRTAAASGRSGWDLERAGYMGWRDPAGGYLVFDAGDIGPDHNTSHAHADTLSFELSHRGERLVTDTGVYTYSRGAMREYDRSTRAHNTLEIDGRDQSEVWAAHRCGRRARIRSRRLLRRGEALELEGAYRGPGAGLSGREHGRRLVVAGRRLAFVDRVVAPGRHRAEIRLHLAPGLTARSAADGVRIAGGSQATRAKVTAEGLEWTIETSPYHPRFGVETERFCLRASAPFRDSLTARWAIHLA